MVVVLASAFFRERVPKKQASSLARWVLRWVFLVLTYTLCRAVFIYVNGGEVLLPCSPHTDSGVVCFVFRGFVVETCSVCLIL